MRGVIGGILNVARGPIEAKLREVLNLRSRSERLWNQIASVQKLSYNPTTWMQIIPRQARASQFQYTPDAILAGLGLDLETRVFVQDQAPPVVNTPLADLEIGGNLSDAFDLSLPVEVSHEAINQQFRAQLHEGPDEPLQRRLLHDHRCQHLVIQDRRRARRRLPRAGRGEVGVGAPVRDRSRSA